MIISLDIPESDDFKNSDTDWFLDYHELEKLSKSLSKKGIFVEMEELEQILILLSEM